MKWNNRSVRGGNDTQVDRNVRPVLSVPADVVPFLTTGTAAIVLGGLIAAVSRPFDWDHGSWAAAFLVLVVGVGQIGLALGQAVFGSSTPSERWRRAELASLNSASALVLLGTVVTSPAAVTAGSVLFLGALTLFLVGTRNRQQVGFGYRVTMALLVLLSVSAPIGVLLTWARA